MHLWEDGQVPYRTLIFILFLVFSYNTQTHTYTQYTHTNTHTHTLAPRSITAEMVVVESSADPLSVNFTITLVSRVVSTFAY